MEWQETFSVGIPEFDEHHFHLLDLMNKAHDSCIKGTQADAFRDIVKDLAEYVACHFTAEERFMKEHNYQNLDAHREEHLLFCKKIADSFDLIASGVSTIEMVELTNFLMDWLFHHILEVDMHYSKMLSVGINVAPSSFSVDRQCLEDGVIHSKY